MPVVPRPHAGGACCSSVKIGPRGSECNPLDFITHTWRSSRAASLHEREYLPRLGGCGVPACFPVQANRLWPQPHTDSLSSHTVEMSRISQRLKNTLPHALPVEHVSSTTCFPTQQHLPQASNKTQIKDGLADLSSHTCTHNRVI